LAMPEPEQGEGQAISSSRAASSGLTSTP